MATKVLDKRFPNAPLFRIRWRGLPVKIGNHPRAWRPLYARMSNGALLYLLFWEINWRMPWLPHAAYSKGWDACFRQLKLGMTE